MSGRPLGLASLGLALGLAAYWLMSAEPGGSPAVTVPEGPVAPAATAPKEAIARARRDAAPPEPRVAADLSLVLPPPEDEVPFEETPTRSPLDSPQNRIDALIAAGVDAERAAEIVQLEAAERLAAAYGEYHATGTVRGLSAAAPRSEHRAVRAALGDEEYERYLRATGGPTRVLVGDVAPDSAAAYAGLLPGDEIRAYGGRRVFEIRELNALMLEGALGATVPISIVRDGQQIELFVSAGPLGIAPRSER